MNIGNNDQMRVNPLDLPNVKCEKCEKIFGFDLNGYGKVRIYAFLAERFLPYWFNKYSKCLEWPIFFNDIRKENFN